MRFHVVLMVLPWTLALCGCTGTWTNRLTLPNRNTLVREQLVLHSDATLPADDPLFEELTAQRDDMVRQLELSSSNATIDVYLFESQERFAGFMHLHHPEFPDRRAFFLETDSRLLVYAQWSDRVAEDLRHEVAHGYLHAAVANIPLWLDEGLAKYYEVPRDQGRINHPLFERLLAKIEREQWQPNLRRLEEFSPTQDMTLDDYAEAWAWVYFLLESRRESASLLREYLADLRHDGSPQPISARLAVLSSQPETELLDHIRELAARSTGGATSLPASYWKGKRASLRDARSQASR